MLFTMLQISKYREAVLLWLNKSFSPKMFLNVILESDS